MIMKVIVVLVLCGALLCVSEAKLKGDDCEGEIRVENTFFVFVFLIIIIFVVCIGFLQRFERRLKENGMDSTTQAKVELELMKICKEAKGKDDRFVSYDNGSSLSLYPPNPPPPPPLYLPPLYFPLTPYHPLLFTVLLHWCCRHLCHKAGECGDTTHVVWQACGKDL